MQTLRLACLALALGACGVNSEGNYQQMRNMLVQGKYADAANFIEGKKESDYGKDNAVLYYMDKMMALHLAKRYQESNELVDKASERIEALYTTSVSAQAGAMMTSDNVIPYEGEDFEKVLIHVVGAMNYVYMGDKDGALVEARRVEQELTALNDRVLKGAKNEKDEAARQASQYSEDAFTRWLIGCLFETDGDSQSLNDALVAYKKALEAYEKSYTPKYKTPVPMQLISDLLRSATALGFSDDVAAFKKKFPTVVYPTAADTKGKGEVVLVHMNGEAPFKFEKHWEAIADNKVIKVAYPEYRVKPKSVAYAILKIGTTEVKTELFEDINAIAIASLKDRMGRVKGKMIARAIVKFAMAKGAEVAGNQASGGLGSLLGAATSIVGAVTEKADLRSWLLLPSSIDVAKAFVPPGKYPVTVTLHSATGGLIRTLKLGDVDVKPGKKAFVSVRSF